MDSSITRVTLATLQASVSEDLDAVFEELARIIQADFPLINQVNDRVLRGRGKMLRPTLLLLSSRAVGLPTGKEVTLAAIVEIIHIATLLHDDSVDHSALRRGQPTVNAEFSHEVAVIMGDYLYSRAIGELVKIESREPLGIMSRVTNDLAVGEMREVIGHDGLDFSEEDYESLIFAKTASLMAGACQLGSLGGREEWKDALRQFGNYLGAAFQITDDLLDYTATAEVTGKPVGQDLREHKITLPLIAALPRMSADERRLVEDLMAEPEPGDELINSVIQIVDSCGGIIDAREKGQQMALLAEAELEQLPPGSARDALGDCITYSVERSR